MIKTLISLTLMLMGLYYIYDHDLFDSKQFVRDIRKVVIIPDDNQYNKEITVNYVQHTDKFIPENKQDLLNIYYTVINSGWDDFTFYCGDEYIDCIKDVSKLSQDNMLLSHLNSFVHPYNSYNNIHTTYYENGKISLNIIRTYNQSMIEKINNEIANIYNEHINTENNNKQNIKIIHDHIIKNTKYDILKIDDIYDATYNSSTAYGALFEGYAVCSGYSDTMALFLNKMNIPNIKVATNQHVWNLVYLDGNWYHLDLTWNNPVTDDDEKILSHVFFLITTEQLWSHETEDHQFDIDIYNEAQ